MKLGYFLDISTPSNHQVNVSISGEFPKELNQLEFFLPRWSPGSYLIREYARHISNLKATNSFGEYLHFVQTDISTFLLDLSKSETKNKDSKFKIEYSVYCHELTVRTSHVDESHAFLHLPTLLMGILNTNIVDPEIELRFPSLWSKVSTALKDISPTRERFLYSAKDYDLMIDSPIEIGCQETDGFVIEGVSHELAFYGETLKLPASLKTDIVTIVDHIKKSMGGFPYENYLFLTHFVPGLFGGLEHSNSTALQFCPFNITTRKGYLNYLCLVSHEYFHTWNVKRLRPIELGPFNYLKEATTDLLWLAEGLTSLMDELFVFRANLMGLEEYLEMQKENLNRYLSVPGRKFHSLDDSSFNAWVKLYRPDENTNNSSISYYLKGGIVFYFLNILLSEQGKSIDDVIDKLWKRTLNNPDKGVTKSEVYDAIKIVGGEKILDQFSTWTETCVEIDIETLLLRMGIKAEWDRAESPWLGIEVDYSGDRVLVKSVILDGPAYKGGLNAGDEILAIDGFRILKDRYNDLTKYLENLQTYKVTVSRLGRLVDVHINLESPITKLRTLTIIDREKVLAVLKGRS